MTNKEAILILKAYKDKLTSSVSNQLDRDIESFDLAIKALEMVDDVNHKVYRNENCPQKHKCYDYQGYHCSGCSWEKKGDTE